MKTIYKYVIDPANPVIKMPEGWVPLTVAEQSGSICLWAEVDPEATLTEVVFVAVGTGHVVPEGYTYIGTAHSLFGMGLVFHLYVMDEE